MARGNIEAMMVCEQYGYSVDDYGNLNSNDPVFAKCVASDNSSNNFPTGFRDYRGIDVNYNFLTLSEMLSQKWMFYGTSSVGITNAVMHLNVFYKVSSD